MQAYKLKGMIDPDGHLVLTEPLHIAPGNVDVIILQSAEADLSELSTIPSTTAETPKRRVSRVKALQDWFENAPPVPPDFDADQAKWEYLKEKHQL